MLKEITIRVESLSKTYKLYQSKRDFVKETFHPLRKQYHNKFHALKNISFNVEKGEVIGIIGKNGSGKSTLLKILASVVTPTSGKYHCNGRVTALLELSGGFNRELTGIQNIKFLGILQGFSKKEMANRTKQILDFAEIGEYANQPVNTYSSGMYMRLAFSLSINIDPDILIVDEILAVGDLRFQQKCFRKIQDFKDEGKTIVLCTQSISTLKTFCTRAIWLHEGEIVEKGTANNIADHYHAFMTSPVASKAKKDVITREKHKLALLATDSLAEKYRKINWHNLQECNSFGINTKCIQYAGIINANSNQNIDHLEGGEHVKVLLYISNLEKVKNPSIHLLLNGQSGLSVFRINSHSFVQPLTFNDDKPSIVTFDFVFPKLGNGQYTLSVGLLSFKNKTKQYIHWVHDALVLLVINNDIKYKMGTQLVVDTATVQAQSAY